ncbi:MAG: cation:proton antiporter [Actinomycetota bacterium]|nr:cation:proton antiporter [Actinomycetota bacterium]
MSLPEWVLWLSTLLTAAVLLGVLAQRVGLQLTVVLAVVGFLAGWLGEPLGIETPVRGEEFEEVLLFLFLPVLIFNAARGLSTRAFFRNLVPILVLAIVAFPISAVLVGLALNLGLGTPMAAALLFGVFISASDPVAVVAVFKQLGVPERLLTLVEGESVLNDGVAIVGYTILLAAALGERVSVLGGFIDFVFVFFGGVAIGAVVGLVAAFVLPWLGQLPAAALSMAVAYGGFVLAEEVLGFSGVTATVAAGLVMSGLAPSRASAEVREMWEELWESLDYVANALLFLLIGLAINSELILNNLGALALAVVVVIVARAAGVLPLVSVLERLAGIPKVGWRNEAVLVWGGLRGGVALALALALPEALPQRETFIAMTGGVVLATLLLNATTISWLVRRLGLSEPSRSERFLAGVARLAGIEAVRERLEDLNLEDSAIASRLAAAERSTREELERIELTDEEELQVVTSRGLFVERETYQRLSDVGLLPPPATRTLLHEVDDQIEEVSLGWAPIEAVRDREPPRLERLTERLTGWLPEPAGEDSKQVAYGEASARRLGARRAGEALEEFERLPTINAETVEEVKETFAQGEREAIASLEELDREMEPGGSELRQRQAEALSRVAVTDALRELAEVGLLPEAMVSRTAEAVAKDVQEKTGEE